MQRIDEVTTWFIPKVLKPSISSGGDISFESEGFGQKVQVYRFCITNRVYRSFAHQDKDGVEEGCGEVKTECVEDFGERFDRCHKAREEEKARENS